MDPQGCTWLCRVGEIDDVYGHSETADIARSPSTHTAICKRQGVMRGTSMRVEQPPIDCPFMAVR